MRKMCLAVLFLLVPLCLAAQCTSAAPVAGTTSGGAPYVIYMPSPASCYNGDMVLFAHGYVPVGSPAGTWEQQLNLLDGTSLPGLLNSLGFGFAASGFSKDGLAILQGIQDTKNLVTAIGQTTPVHKYFITGASEGGLIAASRFHMPVERVVAGVTARVGEPAAVDARIWVEHCLRLARPGDLAGGGGPKGLRIGAPLVIGLPVAAHAFSLPALQAGLSRRGGQRNRGL